MSNLEFGSGFEYRQDTKYPDGSITSIKPPHPVPTGSRREIPGTMYAYDGCPTRELGDWVIKASLRQREKFIEDQFPSE